MQNNNFFIRNGGIFIAIFLSLMSLFFVTNIGLFEPISIIIILLAIPLRCIYLFRFKDLGLNLARVWLWITWDIPLIAMQAAFMNEYSQRIYVNTSLLIAPSDVNFAISIGGLALCVHFVCSFFFKNTQYAVSDSVPNISFLNFVILAVAGMSLMFVTACAAKHFGIGTLSQEGVLLPYKLSGLINYVNVYFTLFFYVFLLDGVMKFKKNILWAIIPIIFFVAINSYVSLSKATVLTAVAVLTLYLIASNKFKMLYMCGTIVVLAFGFILGSYMTSYRDSISSFRAKDFSELSADYSAMQYVHRIFPEGIVLQKFHAYFQTVDKEQTLRYYENNISELHTRGIDGYSYDTMHSSGNSTLASAYCYGDTMLLISIILMSLASVFIDYKLPKLHNLFGSAMFRGYITFFVIFLICNQYLFSMIAPFLGTDANLITSTILPVSVPVIYVLYLKLFCKNVPTAQ